MPGPKTPPPSRFVVIDAGKDFTDLPADQQAILVRQVDRFLRPAVLQVAVALSGLAPVIRVSHNGLRAMVESLDDRTLIPLESKDFKEAQPLSALDIRSLLEAMEAAWAGQFDAVDQDLFARVCGPRFDRLV